MSTEKPQEGGHKKPPIPTPAKKVPAYNIEKRGDRLYEVQNLHKWFAISSLLLFFFTVGMVLQDYSREWKQYQRGFNQLSIRNTVAEGRDLMASIDRARVSELQQELQAAEAAELQGSAEINEVEKQITELNAQYIRADQDYKFAKANLDAEKYAYEEALYQ